MKVAILNDSKQDLGGGFSFIRNLEKGIGQLNDPEYQVVKDWTEADVCLIASPSMVLGDTVALAKGNEKKIVLRLDNVPRNSRNRGAGTTRLYSQAQLADAIVYQSEWARNYLMPFTGKFGEVVYNGVDTEIFNPDQAWKDFGLGKKCYLYSRYNRDETKGWERAWYDFEMIFRQDRSSKLILVGRFSDEIIQYNFDFFQGEAIEYLGVIDDPIEMAKVMRGCEVLLAPYFNDCYSNTIQEAMSCGLEIRADMSGGTPELLHNGVRTLEQMALAYKEVFKNVLL